MKRLFALCLSLCLILSGCSCTPEPLPTGEEPVTDPTVDITAPLSTTEPSVEESTYPPYDLATIPENSAYTAYQTGNETGLELALILNEPFEEGPEPTVVWNEGEYDRLYIIPRYTWSTVYVYAIEWDEEGGFRYSEAPVYTAEAGEGCIISAALDRPEGMPLWYVEVVAEPGLIGGGGLTLSYNGNTGTPAREWIYAESGWSASDFLEEGVEVTYAKPVIYLYPEEATEVSVELELEGELTCTYPAYEKGWHVTARPDGILTDAKGQTYNYLYWEGTELGDFDISMGFCVRGGDTAAFLEEALAQLGLNRREANEFIVYWLPLMESNPYNIITFQQEAYTEQAKLKIQPSPDTLLRVFMVWYTSEEAVDIPPQELTAPERTGFTAVEWGGSQIG